MATTNAEDQRLAQAMRAGGAGGSGAGDGIPACIIEEGVQKYVLIEVGNGARHLVRGNVSADYHRDAAGPTVRLLQEQGMAYRVLGGGRIDYSPGANHAKVYGFSYGFPWDGEYRHDISAEVIKQAMPGCTVETSNEGY